MIFVSALETEQDRSVFEQWYLRYRQDMYAVAYGILRNREDAEDAVHQAFVSLAEHYEKAAAVPENELKAYLIIVTRNTAINFYRSNRRDADRLTALEEDSGTVEINFFEQADYDSLVSAILSLPEKYRDILYLRYLQELSPKETAGMLGISAENVRKRTERAKKLLLHALGTGKE